MGSGDGIWRGIGGADLALIRRGGYIRRGSLCLLPAHTPPRHVRPRPRTHRPPRPALLRGQGHRRPRIPPRATHRHPARRGRCTAAPPHLVRRRRERRVVVVLIVFVLVLVRRGRGDGGGGERVLVVLLVRRLPPRRPTHARHPPRHLRRLCAQDEAHSTMARALRGTGAWYVLS